LFKSFRVLDSIAVRIRNFDIRREYRHLSDRAPVIVNKPCEVEQEKVDDRDAGVGSR